MTKLLLFVIEYFTQWRVHGWEPEARSQLQVTEVSFCVAPPKMFCSCFCLGFNVAETNFGNDNLLGFILMNSCDWKIFSATTIWRPSNSVIQYSCPASFFERFQKITYIYIVCSIVSLYSRGRVFFLSAFLIEEDTELQRTAAISDHLIKTLTGFLVKNDLDDSSYALMREVSTLIYITLKFITF